MAVEVYGYEELGIIIDPPSDTKEVFIPSPPTMATVKINPRAAIIYITGGKITEGCDQIETLKAYAEENKTVLICPAATDTEEVAKTFDYVTKKAKMINIKANEIAVMGDADHMDDAQAIVDYLVDECDADIDDAEEFEM